MTTATIESTQTDADQCVVLRDIDWKGYSTLLRLRGERPVPRMVYLDGSLYLMSPSFPHECLKERLGIFVMEVVVGPGHPLHLLPARRRFVAAPSAAASRGIRPITWPTLDRIRGKKKINLRTDPPPDLAIEAVVTHERGRGRRGLPPVPGARGLGLRSDPARDPGAPAQRPVRRVRAERRLPGPHGRRDSLLGDSRPGRETTPPGSRNSAAGSSRSSSRAIAP